MKVITLLPVKNEEWILAFSLKNFELFSDEIIILDDHSTDRSKAIASQYSKVTVIPYLDKEAPVNMSKRRNLLLEEGRKREGTHFIMIDADETFSYDCAFHMKETIREMNPGETMSFPWILLTRQNEKLVFNPKQKENFKDFIFCGDKISTYLQRNLSEDRTPGDHNKKIEIPYEKGYVLHFQNIAQERYIYKQAWYRCNELMEEKRSAKRINATYAFTKDISKDKKEVMQDHFTYENFHLIRQHASVSFYQEEIYRMFKEKGIRYFEALDIWSIKELKVKFEKETGRIPVPHVYPQWLITCNNIKNNIKNFFNL